MLEGHTSPTESKQAKIARTGNDGHEGPVKFQERGMDRQASKSGSNGPDIAGNGQHQGFPSEEDMLDWMENQERVPRRARKFRGPRAVLTLGLVAASVFLARLSAR